MDARMGVGGGQELLGHRVIRCSKLNVFLKLLTQIGEYLLDGHNICGGQTLKTNLVEAAYYSYVLT